MSAADYYISSLPDLPQQDFDSLKMHSGHIQIDKQRDASLFFWLVEHHHKTTSNVLVVWLNGGPGCSSMDGVFLENGPFRVKKDGSLSINKYGWFYDADLLFVDQPVGTGFSFPTKSIPKSMDQVAADFAIFLTNFFDVFPHLKRNVIYIAGESFAGTYIPYIARDVLRQANKGYSLAGIIIGNGWMDPVRQYGTYIDFAVRKKLVSGIYHTRLENDTKVCLHRLASKETIKDDFCEQLMQTILSASKSNGQFCINMYDIRLRDNGPNDGCGMYVWPDGLQDVYKYLRRDEVIKALHATKKETPWTECDHSVAAALNDDQSEPSYKLFPDILKQITVLLFTGDQDLICNEDGANAMVDSLVWNGAKGLTASAVKKDWYVNGTLYGTYASDRNLTHIIIKGASHMVPVDKGDASLDIINRLIGVQDVVYGILVEV